MTPLVAVVVAVVSAIAAITAAVLTYKASKNATAVEDRKVDLDTYTQAVEFYDKQLERVNTQVDRLNLQLDRVTSQLASEQDVSHSLREKVRILQAMVDTLTQTVNDLRASLAQRGMSIPAN